MKNFFILVLLFVIFAGVSLPAGGMIENVDTRVVKLREDTAVEVNGQTITLKAGTAAEFYNSEDPDRQLLYKGQLAEDAVFTIQGRAVTIKADQIVSFYESGNVKYRTGISEITSFDMQGKEVPVLPDYDIYQPLFFHDNGVVFHAAMAIDSSTFIVQGQEVAIKGIVNFAEDQTLVFGTLTENTPFTVQGKEIMCAAASFVKFYDNSNLQTCFPLETATLSVLGREIAFRRNSAVYFNQNEMVSSGTLAERVTVTIQDTDIVLKKGSAVSFHKNGVLASGHNLRNTVLSVQGKEVAFKAGRGLYLAFHPNGVLKIGFLAEDTELDQEGKPITVPAGYSVEFTEEGELLYANPG